MLKRGTLCSGEMPTNHRLRRSALSSSLLSNSPDFMSQNDVCILINDAERLHKDYGRQPLDSNVPDRIHNLLARIRAELDRKKHHDKRVSDEDYSRMIEQITQLQTLAKTPVQQQKPNTLETSYSFLKASASSIWTD